MNYNLYVNYYIEKNEKRRKELDECMQRNLSNPLLNVIIFESQERMTYNNYLSFAADYTNDDDINIISNLDIYFDDTIQHCSNMNRDNFYALSRWDIKGKNVRHWNYQDSQDVWIFKGKPKAINADFFLGWRGCDNRFAHEVHKAGYKIFNPSLDIKTYHLHQSRVRNYRVKDTKTLVPGPYKLVPPITLGKVR